MLHCAPCLSPTHIYKTLQLSYSWSTQSLIYQYRCLRLSSVKIFCWSSSFLFFLFVVPASSSIFDFLFLSSISCFSPLSFSLSLGMMSHQSRDTKESASGGPSNGHHSGECCDRQLFSVLWYLKQYVNNVCQSVNVIWRWDLHFCPRTRKHRGERTAEFKSCCIIQQLL